MSRPRKTFSIVEVPLRIFTSLSLTVKLVGGARCLPDITSWCLFGDRVQRQADAAIANELSSTSSRRVVVRYAVFAQATRSLKEQIAYLEGSVCSVEAHLRPALSEHGVQLEYVVYTNNQSSLAVNGWRIARFGYPRALAEVLVINLDCDPSDLERMGSLRAKLPARIDLAYFETSSFLSIRRYLADMAHMPPTMGKLLVGTDFEFLQRPSELVDHVVSFRTNFAAYLGFVGAETFVPFYSGRQCRNIINDMVYASPGAPFNLTFAEERLLDWLLYANATMKKGRGRLTPGYCADQWAMHMTLGQWSNGTCRMLSSKYITVGLPWNRPPLPPDGFEGAHAKDIWCWEQQGSEALRFVADVIAAANDHTLVCDSQYWQDLWQFIQDRSL